MSSPDRKTAELSFRNFEEFYPYFLSEHRNPVCRIFHYAGTALGLLVLGWAILSGGLLWILAVPVVKVGMDLLGHIFFERNKPASSNFPLWSIRGDFTMLKDFLSGQLAAKLSRK